MKYLFTLILAFTLCANLISQNTSPHQTMTKVVIQEVIQVNNYTYLKVLENNNEKWLALPTIQAKVGDIYYYTDGMPMGKFESKELNRTFDEITFLSTIYPDPSLNENVEQEHQGKPEIEKTNIEIEKVEGTITIAELFENKLNYSGKIVKINGKVNKFSSKIMGKNWIHLQDGTEFMGEYDLTVTTSATVKVDEIITIEGKVILDKDFGHGYFYKIIIEDGILK